MVEGQSTGLSDLGVKGASGMTIDDFEAIKLIGTGSYGRVILASYKKNDEIYAIKMLKKKHLIKKNQVEHTLTERFILETIKHPFIISMEYAF
jgi:serine/threonine protein kinase